MEIKVLVENTSISKDFKNKHGLSLYIKTSNHKILVDLGSNDTFIKNAGKLDVNLLDIDTVVISHGHDDHGGALKLFLDLNGTAKVYLHKNAFNKHFVRNLGIPINISLDDTLKNHPQVNLINGNFSIDDELLLFSNVKERKYFSSANKSLFTKQNGDYIPDDFNHEQNLIIKENSNIVLFGGCAHNGIVNIFNRAKEVLDSSPTHVISGFHLYNPSNLKTESKDLIYNIANELNKTDAKYYTCHCTGKKAFNFLKEKMNDKIEYISSGQEFTI